MLPELLQKPLPRVACAEPRKRIGARTGAASPLSRGGAGRERARLRGGQLFLAFTCPEGPTVGLSFCLRQLESWQDRRLESFFPSLTEY